MNIRQKAEDALIDYYIEQTMKDAKRLKKLLKKRLGIIADPVVNQITIDGITFTSDEHYPRYILGGGLEKRLLVKGHDSEVYDWVSLGRILYPELNDELRGVKPSEAE